MLTPTVYKSQYKFWEKIKKNIDDDPDSPISKIITLALHNNIPYLKHYKKLHDRFSNADKCYVYDKVTNNSKNMAARGQPFSTYAVRGRGGGVKFCLFPYVHPYKKCVQWGGGVKNG